LWEQKLPAAVFAHNATIHHVTKFSPFYLPYGRDPFLPCDNFLPTIPLTIQDIEQINLPSHINSITKEASENTKTFQSKQKSEFDSKHPTFPFKIHDFVVIVSNIRKTGYVEKFLPKWKGPYEIVEQLSPRSFLLLDRRNIFKCPSHKIRNAQFMKPYHFRYNPDTEISNSLLPSNVPPPGFEDSSSDSDSYFEEFDEPNNKDHSNLFSLFQMDLMNEETFGLEKIWLDEDSEIMDISITEEDRLLLELDDPITPPPIIPDEILMPPPPPPIKNPKEKVKFCPSLPSIVEEPQEISISPPPMVEEPKEVATLPSPPLSPPSLTPRVRSPIKKIQRDRKSPVAPPPPPPKPQRIPLMSLNLNPPVRRNSPFGPPPPLMSINILPSELPLKFVDALTLREPRQDFRPIMIRSLRGGKSLRRTPY